MRWPASLMARLALSVGLVLTVLWLLAASVTGVIVRGEMDEVFDSALRETAERILPLAVTDIVGREDEGVTQRLAPIRELFLPALPYLLIPSYFPPIHSKPPPLLPLNK